MRTKTVNGYTVTDDGRIFSRYGHELRQRTNPKGYKLVSWSVQGPRRSEGVFVHRVVAQAFIPNPMPLFFTQINHIDGNPANNHADNLEWCDCLYNIRDAVARRRAAGLPISGRHYGKAILYRGEVYESIGDMARAFRVDRTVIRDAFRRGRWHGSPMMPHPRGLGSDGSPRSPTAIPLFSLP